MLWAEECSADCAFECGGVLAIFTLHGVLRLCVSRLDPSLIYRLDLWLWFVPPFFLLVNSVVGDEFIGGVSCLTRSILFLFWKMWRALALGVSRPPLFID